MEPLPCIGKDAKKKGVEAGKLVTPLSHPRLDAI